VSRSSTRARGRGLAVLAIALVAVLAPSHATAETGGAAQPQAAQGASTTPFDRQGMWIWYVSQSDGGSPDRIVARARRFGIGTVYVKAGDGGGYWGQFSAALVRRLHAGGLDVCAWQFVYGDHPLAEARVGSAAVRRGADCLVIDAESDYEGQYAAADVYVRGLRARIGEDFPVSLAGFPYVDYHPAFPYSVFLGPGGAQYNQPQMYWKAIGTSVRTVFEHTYEFNRLWGAPIYPIGQTYENPGGATLRMFRRYAASYGLAPSWWDWQETAGAEWGALGANGAARPLIGYRPSESNPRLRRGSRGDMVVWAQEHLVAAGEANLPVTGIYGRATVAAVRDFQRLHRLRPDGVLGTLTWEQLLTVEPVRVGWAARARRASRHRGGARVSALGRLGDGLSRPLSAGLPPKEDELR
jgi:hypothetical protein